MVTRNTLALEAQMEERPLAKKQEELQEASAAQTNGQEVSSHVGMADSGVGGDAAEVGKEKPARRALLKNDDVELERVKAVRVFDVLAISDDGSGHIQNVYLFIALSLSLSFWFSIFRSWMMYINGFILPTIRGPRSRYTRSSSESPRSTLKQRRQCHMTCG